jgi:hypothetical protein
LLSEAIPLAKRLEGQGAEVFVARGGTAMLLRKEGIKTPIVEIHLTSADIVQTLARAKSKGRSLGTYLSDLNSGREVGSKAF